MRRIATLTALALAALLLLSGTAPAYAGWRMDRALQIANVVWHSPCQGHPQVVWGIPLDETAEPLAKAWVDECRIYVAATHEPWPWYCTIILHEVGHLAGYHNSTGVPVPVDLEHPDGRDYDHSANPRSVMYAASPRDRGRILGRHGPERFVFPGTDPRCARRGRPFLLRHGLA